MPRSVGFQSGDGAAAPMVAAVVTLPDSGASVTVEGNVQPVGGALLAISGSPVTGPSVPGSGSTYWIVQVNTSTGAASVKTSSVATPLPDAGSVAIFADVVASTDAGLSTNVADNPPDQW